MASNEPTQVNDDDVLSLGGLIELPMLALTTRGPVDVNGRGMVLVDYREKVTRIVDGKPIIYTVSLYAQRDPLSDVEAEKIREVKADKDRKASERKTEEQQKREREINEATKRGTEGVIAGLKLMAEIGPTLKQAASIAKATGLTD